MFKVEIVWKPGLLLTHKKIVTVSIWCFVSVNHIPTDLYSTS